jgi:hypothetical protein
MAIYILNINERNARGRAFRTLLEKEQDASLIPLEEYEAAEMAALKEAMSAPDGVLLSYEESKAEFARLRKRLRK